MNSTSENNDWFAENEAADTKALRKRKVREAIEKVEPDETMLKHSKWMAGVLLWVIVGGIAVLMVFFVVAVGMNLFD